MLGDVARVYRLDTTTCTLRSRRGVTNIKMKLAVVFFKIVVRSTAQTDHERISTFSTFLGGGKLKLD